MRVYCCTGCVMLLPVLGAGANRCLSLGRECTVADRFAAQGSLWRRTSSIWRREGAPEAAPQGPLQVFVLLSLSLHFGSGHVLLACSSTGSHCISLFPAGSEKTEKKKKKKRKKDQKGKKKGSSPGGKQSDCTSIPSTPSFLLLIVGGRDRF